ncbi:NUDIX hydrolase [Flammeovirga kamogawensis]|uniref:NUDIX domain-containing protein n=1 Tax=Flammeovirga kamogawensis TaxID=373891 RepID=A0ABX8GRT9_9BACT|nr:NUDIX domain-containing protein [Flammeovirga kamogawensis]MBB6464003.1 8-oxo-dGTP pyrophosphatase MutT (NUDIX family) [Flammeovirga kamogawensis]QWG06119.1 NUDIX domain-containing protein [Flammeovirga kamogawensis]TRX67951.1 NUDIX domain-containing protein [Flammeovirga kamogawensis]
MQFYTGNISFELRASTDKHPKENQYIIYGNASADTLWSRYLAAENGDISGSPKYLFYTSNLKKEKEALLSKFQVRIAAGGIVCNEEKLLIIKRNGVYDIPKGHLEKDENLETCATREVEEETGVPSKIIAPLIETYHTYLFNGKYVLKHTYWYTMTVAKKSFNEQPQVEEGIEEVLWMNINDINNIVLINTYKSIKDVIKAFVK